MSTKKVMVSGCFDLFHAGHAKFLVEAAKYGEVYVSVGADANVILLKGIKPTFSQEERCFIVENQKGVKKAFVPKGSGIMDFVHEMEELRPDYFIVNSDGHSEEKRKVCESLGVVYIILEREPEEGFPARSSTELRELNGE